MRIPTIKSTVKCPACKHEFDMNVTILTCERCRHRWVPRQLVVRRCPKCQSVRWDEPKPVARIAPTSVAQKIARPVPIQISTAGPTPAAPLRPINDLTLEELAAELEQGRDNPRVKAWPGALRVLQERRATLAAEHQNGTSSLSAAP